METRASLLNYRTLLVTCSSSHWSSPNTFRFPVNDARDQDGEQARFRGEETITRVVPEPHWTEWRRRRRHRTCRSICPGIRSGAQACEEDRSTDRSLYMGSLHLVLPRQSQYWVSPSCYSIFLVADGVSILVMQRLEDFRRISS